MSETTKAVIAASAVIVVNATAFFAGVSLDEKAVVMAIGGGVILVTTLATAWCNFNFTKAAQEGQLVINRVKNEQSAISLKASDMGSIEVKAKAARGE